MGLKTAFLFGIDAGFHLLTAGCAFWLWAGNLLYFCASGECEWNAAWKWKMYVLGPRLMSYVQASKRCNLVAGQRV